MTAKKIYRSSTDVMIAGICGGIAEYFDIDSSLVRIIFVVLLFNLGTGFLAYLILWFIIPKKNKVINIDEVTEEIKTKAKKVTKEIKKKLKK